MVSLGSSAIFSSETISYQVPEGFETIKTIPVKDSFFSTAPQDPEKAAQEELFKTFRANEKMRMTAQEKAAMQIQNLARGYQARRIAGKELDKLNDIAKFEKQCELDKVFVAASLRNNYAEMKLALNQGADINTRFTRMNRTLLQHAVTAQNPEMVKFLIENGADVNMKGSEETPLFYATFTENPNLEIIFQLVKAGAELNLSAHFAKMSMLRSSIARAEELIEQVKDRLILQQKKAIGAFMQEGRYNTGLSSELFNLLVADEEYSENS